MCINKAFELTVWDGVWHEIDTIKDINTYKNYKTIAELHENTENYRLVALVFPKDNGKYEISIGLKLKYPEKNVGSYPANHRDSYNLNNIFNTYVEAKKWANDWIKDGKYFANNLGTITNNRLIGYYKEINGGNWN